MNMQHPITIQKNAAARQLKSLVWGQASRRIEEGMMHSCRYPNKLAGLVHDDEAKSRAFRAIVKEDIEVHIWRKEHVDEDVRAGWEDQFWESGPVK